MLLASYEGKGYTPMHSNSVLRRTHERYFSMETARILLVDDDPALQQALSLMVSLRMSNVQVHTADSVDYILKPVDRDDLVASLYRALHTQRLQQEIRRQQQALERYALNLERLVEQRTGELRAAQRANETILRTLGDELNPVLAQLRQETQQIEDCFPATGRPKTLEQNLANMRCSLQELENIAARVQQATSIQSDHLASKHSRM